MRKNRKKKLHFLYFLVPCLLLFVLFTSATYLIVENRVKNQYETFETSSENLARSYKTTIETYSEAYLMFKEILGQKMRAAAESVLFYDGVMDEENLKVLGEKLQLDAIYLYDLEGTLVSSMDGQFVGWSPSPGHPVERYQKSGDYYMEENIRQDTESKLHYKYVYIRRADGYFYQLGVLAENINGFMAQFESQALLDEIYKEHEPYLVLLLNRDETVQASSELSYIGKKYGDLSLQTNRAEAYRTGRTDIKGIPVFLTVTPVAAKEEEGLLLLAWDLRGMDLEVEKIIFYGVLIFIVIFLIVTGTLYYAFKKRGKLYEIAYYEERTGLPNEQFFREYVNKEIHNHRLQGKDFILLHLENLAILSHTYGHEYGELLLKEVSERIRTQMGIDQELFFLDGEYLGIFCETTSREGNRDFLRNLQELFSRDFSAEDERDRLQVKIGVVPDIGHFRTSAALLKAATIAAGKNTHHDAESIPYFDEKMEEHAERERSILRNLRLLLEGKDHSRDRLFLHFQPKISLDTEEIIGFEALARFRIPDYGMIPPLEFIEIAERNHLIYDLGLLILREACAFLRELDDAGMKRRTVAVNISVLQLLRKEFTAHVEEVLKEYEIDPEMLEFEITESILSDNFDLINLKLRQIRKKGIKVSMDDFGTGFSSLARLRELSIDAVKLDRHFISRIKENEKPSYISIDIISMAHREGLKVVAEGVETEEQLDFLKKYQCDYAQGYYISMPLEKDKALEMLINEKRGNGFRELSS
ncbi:putative bifunctional diguanylate cyclase/phosphodiesterase [Proteiniclasticum ruminis]|uniref:Diguanylate cyclase (GGDEF) domain-containing protein n=1 Tax=Proteiniclasticum ruminis TaxID=398199 RepID=A0A1G8HLC9_9CLOT|nr:GGDEF domain-containing phosphodiesterase [Proteiniclasticum ruminis]SDI07443.1 diguanylate cyclase (GGDEF) domain-containing protein [Proteiniclasticum ruminis]